MQALHPALFARARLEELLDAARPVLPGASFGAIEDCTEVPVSCADLVFANGVRLTVCNDLDLPTVLFEVLRLALPPACDQLEFEQWHQQEPRATKLTSEGALQLLVRYAGAGACS